MKDQRTYFEKADFSSNFPLQILAAALGLILVSAWSFLSRNGQYFMVRRQLCP